jgi:hypothetical protein
VGSKAVRAASRAAAGNRSLVSSSRNPERAASEVAKADSRISAKHYGTVKFSSPGSPGDFFIGEQCRMNEAIDSSPTNYNAGSGIALCSTSHFFPTNPFDLALRLLHAFEANTRRSRIAG